MPGNFIKYPDGDYELEVENIDLSESAQKGTPFAAVTCAINKCRKTKEGRAFTVPAGAVTTVKIWLTDKTLVEGAPARNWLEAAGFEFGMRNLSDLKKGAAKHFSGKGFIFSASCKNEKYTNKEGVEDNYANFEAYPIKKSKFQQVSSNSLARLDALFGAKRAAPAASVAFNALPGNDDIPF